MMNYAFMTFSTPNLTLDEVLSLARRLGYAGIEPRVESNHRHGVERTADASTRAAIRAAVERAGVALACVATSCKFAVAAALEQTIVDARAYIDLAADVGSGRIRVFGGDHPGASPAEAADVMVDGLRRVADHAAGRGVYVCVETHDAWSDPAAVADVLRRVDHPHVAVNWDLMHTLRHGTPPAEAFALLGPYVRHVHVHDGSIDGKHRIVPVGTGQIDHAEPLRLLRAAGYDGFVSGEWIASMMTPEHYADHLAPELAALRRLEAATA